MLVLKLQEWCKFRRDAGISNRIWSGL